MLDTSAPLNKIDRFEIRDFVATYNRTMDEFLLDGVIRRTDTDEDELLSYSEFAEVVKVLSMSAPEERKSAAISPRRRSSSPLRPSRSPARTSRFETSYVSAAPLPTPPVRRASPMRGYEEEELIDGLKRIIDQEKLLDQAKERLLTHQEFNLVDAFRLFDFSSLGSIAVADIQDAFNAYGVFPARSEA
jgi:Ca2+-binding EF-hand superfamily protein